MLGFVKMLFRRHPHYQTLLRPPRDLLNSDVVFKNVLNLVARMSPQFTLWNSRLLGPGSEAIAASEALSGTKGIGVIEGSRTTHLQLGLRPLGRGTAISPMVLLLLPALIGLTTGALRITHLRQVLLLRTRAKEAESLMDRRLAIFGMEDVDLAPRKRLLLV